MGQSNMDPITIISTILGVINVASKAIEFGKDAAPFIKAIIDQFEGKSPSEITQADLDALEAKVDALSAELQMPLPPE